MLSLQDLVIIIQTSSFLGPVVMSNEARSLHVTFFRSCWQDIPKSCCCLLLGIWHC